MRIKRDGKFIWMFKQWPEFRWDDEALRHRLTAVRHLQGKIVGAMDALGFRLRDEATLGTLTADVLKTSEIEGEHLSQDQVRSSIARRLGMDISGLVPSDKHVDGVVEMLLDATRRCDAPLTAERIFVWHKGLFPTGFDGRYRITVGQWRDDSQGPMQVVSGGMGMEKVHFKAPPAASVPAEMETFLHWFNRDQGLDPVIKAAVAHLWFLTIHPLDDGNGRVARAIADLQLARADQSTQRFYSMSAQIRLQRKEYYDMLEHTQRNSLDITPWLDWFLRCLEQALLASEGTLAGVLDKHAFWNTHRHQVLNERQHKLLNMLMDGFEGKLTSSKWAKIAKCSPDSALRDINDLVAKGALRKDAAGGRSTHYELVFPAR